MTALGLFLPVADRVAISTDKEVFNKWCMASHGKGHSFPDTIASEARYKGAVLGPLRERNDPSADLVKYFIRNGISVMPFFRKTENSDTELDAPARYLQKQEVPKVSLTSR
ncbi:c-type cytochrome [Pseudomonas frederiksbergensis]|uniref:c-type cytochrome n=1 Tax=Pseudomonas frederiksbergensis TaxID=104087 RepID=UPI0035B546DD